MLKYGAARARNVCKPLGTGHYLSPGGGGGGVGVFRGGSHGFLKTFRGDQP